MVKPDELDEIERLDFLSSILRSVYTFDLAEVRPVVDTLLAPNLLEECHSLLYVRINVSVGSMLKLNHVADFQAHGMLARALFELTADIQLLDLDPQAAVLMRHYMELEKLRLCRSSVAFAKEQCHSPNPIHDIFIKNCESQVNTTVASLWPGKKPSDIKHWTAKDFPTRVKRLEMEMQTIYADHYKRLSWAAHAGLQGSYGLSKEAFPKLCLQAFHLVTEVYEKALLAMITNLQLYKADRYIREKLRLARQLPFIENREEEADLRRQLGLS